LLCINASVENLIINPLVSPFWEKFKPGDTPIRLRRIRPDITGAPLFQGRLNIVVEGIAEFKCCHYISYKATIDTFRETSYA